MVQPGWGNLRALCGSSSVNSVVKNILSDSCTYP